MYRNTLAASSGERGAVVLVESNILPESIGAQIERTLDAEDGPPPLGSLAQLLARDYGRAQRRWLALEAALALDDACCDRLIEGLRALDPRPRRPAADALELLDLDAELLDPAELREAIAILWRRLGPTDRESFVRAVTRKRKARR